MGLLIPARAFTVVDTTCHHICEPSNFTVWIGSNSRPQYWQRLTLNAITSTVTVVD